MTVLFAEPDGEAFADAIEATQRGLSQLLQHSKQLLSLRFAGPAGTREPELLFHRARVDILAFGEAQVEFARDAWRRFGKGNHPANLNFGDCFSYALSKSSGELLLFEVMTFPKLMYRVDLRKGAGQAMEKLDYVLMRLEEKVQASSEQKAGLTKPKIVRCNRPSCSRISVLMYRYN